MKVNYEQLLSENQKNVLESYIRKILSIASQKGMISFAGGLPNPSLFPINALQKSTNHVMQQHGKELLQYANSMGYEPLRNWIAKRYSKLYNIDISTDQVVITNGSQQTIDITSRLFINPGDGVIIEKPCYLGALQAISAYRPTWIPVSMDQSGAIIKDVKQVITQTKTKLMYIVPNFQNPSGKSYNLNRRMELAKLLQQHNTILLEDDPYNEIRYSGEFIPPVYAFAPENVIWTGSFSKMVAPGLRTGWAILPKELVPYFVKSKQACDLHTNNLTQMTLAHYLCNNIIDNHLDIIRAAYKEQSEAMQYWLNHYFDGQIEYTQPDGGMFLWLTLPKNIDASKLVTRTIKKGVVFVPGQTFFTNNEGKNNIRMNFSNSNSDTIQKGIKIIADEIKIRMTANSHVFTK